MPVYEYQCKSCEHSFQEMHKIDDRKIPVENPCPECGEKEVQQLIGNVSIIDPFTIGKLKPTKEFQEKAKSLKRFYRKDIIKDLDR